MWQTKYASAVHKNLGVRVNFRPCSAVKAISSPGVRSLPSVKSWASSSSSSTFIYNNGFAQKAALGRFMMFVKYKIRMTWTFPFTQLHITHTYLYIQNPKQAHHWVEIISGVVFLYSCSFIYSKLRLITFVKNSATLKFLIRVLHFLFFFGLWKRP